MSERKKGNAIEAAASANFGLSDGRSVDAAVELGMPGWSLYSIEAERRIASFVRLAPEIDLADAPFAYMLQYERAEALLEVALDDLEAIVAGWKKPDKLTIILGPGRARSTLASAILATQRGLWSLSEPDSYTNLARSREHVSHADVGVFVGPATRLAYAPRDPDDHHFVLKPRSQATYFAPEFASAFPDAKIVFLYRGAVGWVESMYKVGQRLNVQPSEGTTRKRFLWDMLTGYTDITDTEVRVGRTLNEMSLVEVLACVWACNLRAAAEAQAQGVDMTFVHQSALAPDNPEGLSDFFEACGVQGDAGRAAAAFGVDSQEGSALAQSIPAQGITSAQVEEIERVLSNAPVWHAPLPASAISDR
ncbi:MAG: hypothetical protein HRU32_04225 [Rhodobacteraceae bacterium]|nr:hypothetical protein [Paracoccaceae bacterium]